MAGKTNLERAQADEIADTIWEIMNSGLGAMFSKEGDEKKAKVAAFAETMATGLQKLEKRLEARGGQFFAGNCLTWADLQLFQCLDFYKSLVPSAVDKFPKLKDLACRVGELPNIKHWMKTRPATPR